MNKSRGSKKGLQTLVTMVALVAALASTGCTKNSLMGPDTGTTVGTSDVANTAGNTMKQAGNTMRP